LRFLLADYGAWYLVTLGLLAMAVMVKAPQGIWGFIARGLDIQFFPIRRHVRLELPSSEAAVPPDSVKEWAQASRP
jgi:hypothetical protein